MSQIKDKLHTVMTWAHVAKFRALEDDFWSTWALPDGYVRVPNIDITDKDATLAAKRFSRN